MSDWPVFTDYTESERRRKKSQILADSVFLGGETFGLQLQWAKQSQRHGLTSLFLAMNSLSPITVRYFFVHLWLPW